METFPIVGKFTILVVILEMQKQLRVEHVLSLMEILCVRSLVGFGSQPHHVTTAFLLTVMIGNLDA